MVVWRVPVKALEKHCINQYMKNGWGQFCMWLRAGDFAQENPHCGGQILCWSCISELITNFELLKLSYDCQTIVGCFHLPACMVPPCGHWEWGRSVFLSPSQQENHNGWKNFDMLEGTPADSEECGTIIPGSHHMWPASGECPSRRSCPVCCSRQ